MVDFKYVANIYVNNFSYFGFFPSEKQAVIHFPQIFAEVIHRHFDGTHIRSDSTFSCISDILFIEDMQGGRRP